MIPYGKWLKKIRLRRVLQAMRGYRTLRMEQKGDAISNLKGELTTLALDKNETTNSSLIYGAAKPKADAVFRQYLLYRLGGTSFNLALMRSVTTGKLIYPLPPSWRPVVERYGFKVATVPSALMWLGYTAMLFSYGVFQWLKMICKRDSWPGVNKQSAYLAELSPTNFSSEHAEFPINITQWYSYSKERDPRVEEIAHNVSSITDSVDAEIPVRYCSGPLPPLKSYDQRIRLLAWGGKAVALAFLRWCTGRADAAFMFEQSVLAAKARVLGAPQLAAEYLFHNSNWIYRPLWTYDAEACGSSVVFYLYSANNELFKLGEEKPPAFFFGLEGLTWSKYWVWDASQVMFIRKAIHCTDDIELKIVGPIPFEGSRLAAITDSEKPVVCVFDVQPSRNSIHQSRAIPFDYYTHEVMRKFLLDICEVSSDLGVRLVWKKKRGMRGNTHKNYRSLGGDERIKNVEILSHDTSPFSIVRKCAAVISVPFTSTALVARSASVETIYYDPTGLVSVNEPAAHGVPIVNDKACLRNWFLGVVENYGKKSIVGE